MRLLTVAFKLCSAGSRGVTAIKISGQSVLLNKCLQNSLPKYGHFTMSVRSTCYPWVAFVLPFLIAVTCGNGVKRIISTISARLYNPILRSNHKTNPQRWQRGICVIGLDRISFGLRMNSCISRRESGDQADARTNRKVCQF